MKLPVGGGESSFDFAVLAVPFDVLSRMLPGTTAAEPLRQTLARFETSPITGIHLWFDRQITDLDHAVLLDRTIQWMFHKSRLLARTSSSTRTEGPTRAQTSAGEQNPARVEGHSETGGHDFSRATEAANRGGALAPEVNGSYVELVVSSSKALVEKSKTEITELALHECASTSPRRGMRIS